MTQMLRMKYIFVSQSEVYYLIRLNAEQSFQAAQWDSNKTTLPTLIQFSNRIVHHIALFLLTIYHLDKMHFHFSDAIKWQCRLFSYFNI